MKPLSSEDVVELRKLVMILAEVIHSPFSKTDLIRGYKTKDNLVTVWKSELPKNKYRLFVDIAKREDNSKNVAESAVLMKDIDDLLNKHYKNVESGMNPASRVQYRWEVII